MTKASYLAYFCYLASLLDGTRCISCRVLEIMCVVTLLTPNVSLAVAYKVTMLLNQESTFYYSLSLTVLHVSVSYVVCS